ncbi:MAG: hypothetical protein ABJG86_10775 [Nitratireductor sp.]
MNHFKAVTTYRLLVAPADDNYFLARWCRIYSLHAEFFWQAQQAIEKYMKAGLVVNDVPAHGLSHDLSAAFERFELNFGDLTPRNFKKPPTLKNELWRPKTTELFLKKIEMQGHPDSRYRLISWFKEPSDLFMLDQLVFSLRRMTVGMQWTVGTDWKVPAGQKRYIGRRFDDILRNYPRFQPRGRIKIPSGPANVAGDRIEDALFAWNFSYRRSRHDTDRKAPASVASSMPAASNSETYLMYRRMENASRASTPILLDGVRWFIDHFHLDKRTKKSFEQKLAEAAQRS